MRSTVPLGGGNSRVRLFSAVVMTVNTEICLSPLMSRTAIAKARGKTQLTWRNTFSVTCTDLENFCSSPFNRAWSRRLG